MMIPESWKRWHPKNHQNTCGTQNIWLWTWTFSIYFSWLFCIWYGANCWLLSAVLDLFPRLVPVFFKNHQAKPPPFFLSRVTKGLTKIGQSCVWFAAIFIRWDAPWTSQILSNLSLSGWSPWWRVARSWDLPWPMRVRRGCLRNFKRFSPWVRSFQKDKHIAKSRVVFASQTFFVGWQQWFNDSRIFFG